MAEPADSEISIVGRDEAATRAAFLDAPIDEDGNDGHVYSAPLHPGPWRKSAVIRGLFSRHCWVMDATGQMVCLVGVPDAWPEGDGRDAERDRLCERIAGVVAALGNQE